MFLFSSHQVHLAKPLDAEGSVALQSITLLWRNAENMAVLFLPVRALISLGFAPPRINLDLF